jgi:hypothetical protein
MGRQSALRIKKIVSTSLSGSTNQDAPGFVKSARKRLALKPAAIS